MKRIGSSLRGWEYFNYCTDKKEIGNNNQLADFFGTRILKLGTSCYDAHRMHTNTESQNVYKTIFGIKNLRK